MKIIVSALVCASMLLVSSGVNAADVKREKRGLAGFFKKDDANKVQPEDEAYWSRLMQESFSVEPTPPPPTPRPPTPAPKPGECLVDATVTCVTENGVECNEVGTPDEGDCLQEVTYSYTLENIGEECMTITVVTRTRDGVTDDLIDLVENKELCPGESTVVTETETVDFCTEQEICTSVAVEADPPEGAPCFDTDEYCLETVAPPVPPPTPPPTRPPGGCLVDVTVTCLAENDVECNEVVIPEGGDCTQEVTYSYTLENIGEECMTITVVNRTRDGVSEDLIALVPDTELCPGDTTVVTETETVDFCQEQEICTTVEAEADPPEGDPCFDSDEYCLETAAPPVPPPTPTPTPPPDVACEVDAEVTCTANDDAGTECNALDPADGCEVEVTYTYTAENIGTNDMTITSASSQFKTEPVQEVPIVGTELTPGETVTYMETKTIDICTGETCPTTFEVEAESENGLPCEDADVYELVTEIPPTPPPPTPEAVTPSPVPEPTTPPTPAPTEECDIKIEVGCVPLEGGTNATSCEQLPPLVTICEERATWMQFKYYGGDCSQSANMQTEKFFCTDFAPIPQDAPVYIEASATKDAELFFFTGEVDLNGLYNVTDPSGDRLPADMNLTIYDSQGGTLLQRVQYHSSCSQNLFLKDRYGASQLVAFFNEAQGLVDCFITSNLTFTISNEATEPAVLDSLVALTTPFGPFDLTAEVANMGLTAGEEFVVYLPIELDLTVRQRYTVLATITGRTPADAEACSSSDFLDFIAGNALPPSIPTAAPTTSPA